MGRYSCNAVSYTHLDVYKRQVEDIPLLCDIAMDGDRGICSKMDGYEFNLGKVIAQGDGICEIRIDRKAE